MPQWKAVRVAQAAAALTTIFNNLKYYYLWYNGTANPPIEISAVHPRRMVHRCLDDLSINKSLNGFTIAFENQTDRTLELEDFKDWYGYNYFCLDPLHIDAFETVFMDRVYSPPLSMAAAAGYRYKIIAADGAVEYLYIAVFVDYIWRYYTYVLLSPDGSIDWNNIQNNLSQQSSVSESDHFRVNSTIDYEASAKAVIRFVPKNVDKSVFSDMRYMLTPWRNPANYKDEL